MNRFSQKLQHVLKTTRWNKKELARQAEVSPSNVSRWEKGSQLPNKAALGKIIDALPEEQAADLVVAWLRDSLPENAANLVGVTSKHPSSIVRDEATDPWPEIMGPELRRKFIDFAHLACERDEVMDIVDVLHTAAMRLKSSGGKSGKA